MASEPDETLVTMPESRPDPAGVAGRRAIGRDPVAPGRVGLVVLAIATATAALVAVLPGPDPFWLCVPAMLAAAARCRTRRATVLASALVLLAAGAPALARGRGGPAPWAALLVPVASVVVLETTRTALARERDGLRDFALTDPLTRIANRRFLLAQADHEIARHRRDRRPFAVVMLDLDGFKSLNDRFGHAAGDDLLREVAAGLVRAMRAQDTVGRIGGDEFCVLAPETDAGGAAQLATRVTAAIAAVTAGVETVQGSVGVAVFPQDAQDPAALIAVADERLLEAKRRRPERQARRAA